MNVVTPRSEANLVGLTPTTVKLARAFLAAAAESLRNTDYFVQIISGHRTYEQQNTIFAQGRTTAGKIVTNAKGGQSNHNFGLAFDIGVFKVVGGASSYIPESPVYDKLGAVAEGVGLLWGGRWKNPTDKPHFEFRPPWAMKLGNKEFLAECRNRRSSGLPIDPAS